MLRGRISLHLFACRLFVTIAAIRSKAIRLTFAACGGEQPAVAAERRKHLLRAQSEFVVELERRLGGRRPVCC